MQNMHDIKIIFFDYSREICIKQLYIKKLHDRRKYQKLFILHVTTSDTLVIL